MADTSGAAWTVTAQTEETGLNDAGMYVPGVKVAFTTAKGVRASVFVPTAEYNPDNVRRVVSARAADVDAIAGMQG